jgi:hypothetical protein
MMVVPSTLDQLKQTIQVLQQLQRLLPLSATLSDVTDLLTSIEARFGAACLLEDTIQNLVAEHLTIQLVQREALRQSEQMKWEVAT